MKSLLLVIDLQNAFMNKHTKKRVNEIKKLIDNKDYNCVAFTRFINFEDSIFVKKLNWSGCIQDKDKEIVINTGNCEIFNKSIYSAVNQKLIDYISDNEITNIYLCGVDTDCCVLKTAFDMFELGYNVYVLKDYCASMCGEELHNNALEILKRNIGKDYII
ncbi:MAG: cysteine hydrolase [Bacilli bacterium]|nr:cysteine hydrolase [Bacilli bacterium]